MRASRRTRNGYAQKIKVCDTPMSRITRIIERGIDEANSLPGKPMQIKAIESFSGWDSEQYNEGLKDEQTQTND